MTALVLRKHLGLLVIAISTAVILGAARSRSAVCKFVRCVREKTSPKSFKWIEQSFPFFNSFMICLGLPLKEYIDGNKAKGRISKRVFQESKASQIFRKTNISYPLIRTTISIIICGSIKVSQYSSKAIFIFQQIWYS